MSEGIHSQTGALAKAGLELAVFSPGANRGRS